jgi:hypothetical protein
MKRPSKAASGSPRCYSLKRLRRVLVTSQPRVSVPSPAGVRHADEHDLQRA